MADSANSILTSRRHALVMFAGAAALAVVPAIAAAQGFDAASYVAMWRRHGNVPYFDDWNGRAVLGVYFPDRSTMPPNEELSRWRTGCEDDPSWKSKVIDYLKAEQSA